MRFTRSVFFFGVLLLSACAGTPTKLQPTAVKPNERVIFGRYIDLNPDGFDLRLTYVLSPEAQNEFLNLENKFPEMDRTSGYFWTTVPETARYIGVRSLYFAVKGHSGEAVIRDQKAHLPLFGVDLPEGRSPVYVGEIAIRSDFVEGEKDFVGLKSEAFQLKEIAVRSEPNSARKFLESRGIDASFMVERPLPAKDAKVLLPDLTIPKKFKN